MRRVVVPRRRGDDEELGGGLADVDELADHRRGDADGAPDWQFVEVAVKSNATGSLEEVVEFLLILMAVQRHRVAGLDVPESWRQSLTAKRASEVAVRRRPSFGVLEIDVRRVDDGVVGCHAPGWGRPGIGITWNRGERSRLQSREDVNGSRRIIATLESAKRNGNLKYLSCLPGYFICHENVDQRD